MNKIDYLQSYKDYYYRQQSYKDERNLILTEEAQPPGIDYSADRVQTSPEDGTLTKILRIEDRTRECDRNIRFCAMQMSLIRESVYDVSDGELQRLLHLRYIQFKRWESIATELGYSMDYTKGKLHYRAIKAVKVHPSVKTTKKARG